MLVFVGLVPLLFLEDKITNDGHGYKKVRLFSYAYLSFLIWNTGTTWWIVNSSVFGMVFAIFCNTLFYTLLIMLFHWSVSYTHLTLPTKA